MECCAETPFSTPRQAANLGGKDLEVTLERTIAYTQNRRTDNVYVWYNQLNVGSGVCGSNADRKTAADLVRHPRTNPPQLDLIELKAWGTKDTPLHTAIEVVRYGFALLILGRERLDPHFDRLSWPQVQALNLFVLTPDDWYACSWADLGVDCLMEAFHDAMKAAKVIEPKLTCCTFFPKCLRLNGLTREQFLALLSGPDPTNPTFSYANLTPERLVRINAWVDDAFRPVEDARALRTKGNDT